MHDLAPIARSPAILALAGLGCWLALLGFGVAARMGSWGKGEWHWRRFFWGYVAFSLVVVASFLVARGLSEHLGRLLIWHGVPVLFAGPRPKEGRGFGVRVVAFVVGSIALGMCASVFDYLARGRPQLASGVPTVGTGVREPSGRATATATSVSSLPPSAASPFQDRIGVGYRVKDGVFESAISGLRVESVPGYLLVGRDEWFAAGPTGPEVILQNPEASIQVFIESVPSANLEASLRLMRQITRISRQRFEGGPDRTDAWQMPLLGELRVFEAFRTQEWVARDAYFGLAGRAYRVTVEHASTEQAVRDKVERLASAIQSLPPGSREKLRQELVDTPDAQASAAEASVVRGRKFVSFRHGVGWTAPAGFWRFLSEAALELTGSPVLFGAVDDERAYRFLVGVFPQNEAPLADVLGAMSASFQGPPGATEQGVTAGKATFLSRSGSVSSEGMEGIVHAAVWRNRNETFFLTLEGNTEASEDLAKTLRQIMAGFTDQVPASVAEHKGGVYLDHRMGFSFREPAGWTFSTTAANADGIVGTDAVWSLEGVGRITVSAAFHSGAVGYADALGEVVYAGLLKEARDSIAGALNETTETLAGRRARHLSASRGAERFDAIVIERSGFAFVLRSEGQGTQALELLERNFALLP